MDTLKLELVSAKYKKIVSSTLESEATDNHFTDVTLVSDDFVQFLVHKFVLGACSPVLK